MVYYNKNKNELLVLTGAVYAFIAYLTAFTLEVLFIIDLAKRNTSPTSSLTSTSTTTTTSFQGGDDDQASSSFAQAKWAIESLQTHMTISYLAVSILYLIMFLASLLLITALILRSTFFLLIWMCVMTTMYLPEFGLIVYVSLYSWGIETRNGQTELIFYLLRAALNVIFIFRSHRLFKDWNYEKNFFKLKSGGTRYAGYDSPYFIGDSLTTTINPVFSSSTLNFDRYDHIRNLNNSPNNTIATNNSTNNIFPEYSFHHHLDNGRKIILHGRERNKVEQNNFKLDESVSGRNSYLRDEALDNFNHMSPYQSHLTRKIAKPQLRPNNSMLSISSFDEFADYEMDLDYRTLTNQRHYNNELINHNNRNQQQQQAGRCNRELVSTISNQHQQLQTNQSSNLSCSLGGMSYSTQSLDRRHLKDIDLTLPGQVVLRPLGHQPFDYLHRPGSTTNLNNNSNTQLTTYSSSTALTKKNDMNAYDLNR